MTSNYDINRRRPDIASPAQTPRTYSLEVIKKWVDTYIGDVDSRLEKQLEQIREDLDE